MVRKIITNSLSHKVKRRDFLKGATALGAATAFPAIITRSAFAQDVPTVVNSIRSLSNPYHATWNKGGAAFAKAVGAEYVTLVTEGNSEKGIADIKAILAKTGGNCVINVDPNDSPDARPIVEAVKAAGATVVTQWNKPNDLHPWDFDPNYVAHISFSGVPYGKADGGGPDQGDGWQGRHRRARWHRVRTCPLSSARLASSRRLMPTRTLSCSTYRWRTGRRPRRSRRLTPG